MKRGLSALVAVLMAALSPRAAAQSEAVPVFGAGVESVLVDVFASSDGKPLLGLDAADFEVKDDGVVQPVELLSHEQSPLHALLLLDTSNSLAGDTLESLKRAARAFLSGLRDGDRASLLTFNERVQLRGLGLSRDAARAALENARAEGGTSLYDAIYTALGYADPREGRPVMVVFSDGDDRLSWLTAEKVLQVAREADASIYAVDTSQVQGRLNVPRGVERHNDAMGDRANFLAGQRSQDVGTSTLQGADRPPTFLERAAEETGGRVLQAGRADLQPAFLSVLGELTSRYVLRFTPPAQQKPGWHELRVKLKGRKGDLRVRKGYFVPERAAG